jgi:molybdopterin synthase catalytic subunit
MIIAIRSEEFNPWHEIDNVVNTRGDFKGSYGANAVFVGTMRDFNEGDEVRSMHLEHYPGMTEKELERLCVDCCEGREVLELLVVHRVGNILPGDYIVLVSVWSAHRAEAFHVCREVMEMLKHRAPFWKKEQLIEGERWVEKNTPG